MEHRSCDIFTPQHRDADSAQNAQAAAGVYLRADMASSPPRRLGMMLYDSAIRLCRQAMDDLDDGNAVSAGKRLKLASESVRRLMQTVQKSNDPQRRRFRELYREVHTRLSEAGYYRRREPLKETITLLDTRRRDWRRFDDTPRASQRENLWIG